MCQCISPAVKELREISVYSVCLWECVTIDGEYMYEEYQLISRGWTKLSQKPWSSGDCGNNAFIADNYTYAKSNLSPEMFGMQ